MQVGGNFLDGLFATLELGDQNLELLKTRILQLGDWSLSFAILLTPSTGSKFDIEHQTRHSIATKNPLLNLREIIYPLFFCKKKDTHEVL